MSTQKEIVSNLVKDVESLKLSVASLEEKVNAPVVAPVEAKPVETVGVVAPEVKLDEFPKYPIPPDFIAVVDEVLNKDFGVELEPLPDSAGFNFKIIVPEKYSNTPPEKRDGRDVRPRVISYAEGANGIRLWAEKVLENLGEDIKFRIVQDRPFANRPI